MRPLETAEYVHGETGLNGAGLPEPKSDLAPGHAVDAIIDILRREPEGSVTLCPTGPLTNIALAMVKEPEILARAREIVLMGGAIDLGNVTPAAEFNIYVDPHAASVVYGFGLPITMFGLDVTHKVLVNDARLEAIHAVGTPGSLRPPTACSNSTRATIAGATTRMADRCTIPASPPGFSSPEIFGGRDCHVEIETASPTSMGPDGRRLVAAFGPGAQRPCGSRCRCECVLRAAEPLPCPLLGTRLRIIIHEHDVFSVGCACGP